MPFAWCVCSFFFPRKMLSGKHSELRVAVKQLRLCTAFLWYWSHSYCLLPGAVVTFCFAARLLLHRSQGGILPSLTLVIQDLNCELADAWGFSLALLLNCWQSNQCSVSWPLPPMRVLPNKMDVQMLLCSPTVLLSLAIPVLPYLSFLCLCSLL